MPTVNRRPEFPTKALDRIRSAAPNMPSSVLKHVDVAQRDFLLQQLDVGDRSRARRVLRLRVAVCSDSLLACFGLADGEPVGAEDQREHADEGDDTESASRGSVPTRLG